MYCAKSSPISDYFPKVDFSEAGAHHRMTLESKWKWPWWWGGNISDTHGSSENAVISTCALIIGLKCNVVNSRPGSKSRWARGIPSPVGKQLQYFTPKILEMYCLNRQAAEGSHHLLCVSACRVFISTKSSLLKDLGWLPAYHWIRMISILMKPFLHM